MPSGYYMPLEARVRELYWVVDLSRRLTRVLPGLRALACSDRNPDKTHVRHLNLALYQTRGFELAVYSHIRTSRRSH
jgi:hypothetical protein